jgi:hypothetical protein
MKPLVSAMFWASLKFMAKLKVLIYFSVQLKFCVFQCDYHLVVGGWIWQCLLLAGHVMNYGG